MKHIIYFVFLFITISLSAQEKNVFDVARSGTVAEMTELIKADKGIVDAKDDRGFTPLILAVYRNNEEVVNLLVSKTSTINYNSSSGTALVAASYKGLPTIVEALLKNNADSNIADSNGTTALIYATLANNIEIVQLLLKNGADRNAQDNRGNSAMDYASISKNEKLIDILK